MDWVGLAQDIDYWSALVNVVMNLLSSIKCWEVYEWLHLWWLFELCSAL